MPSGSVSNLYNHLLIRHLFLISKFSIPRPPWSLGRQRISHRARWYFLLASSDCQKKRDLKKSSCFWTPSGIWKNESRNIGILVSTELIRTSRPPYSTELIRTSRPPYVINWPFQQLIFFKKFVLQYISILYWIAYGDESGYQVTEW